MPICRWVIRCPWFTIFIYESHWNVEAKKVKKTVNVLSKQLQVCSLAENREVCGICYLNVPSQE